MKVLLLFTGGTISMVRDAKSGALHPADMATFQSFVPELFVGDVEVCTCIDMGTKVTMKGWRHDY